MIDPYNLSPETIKKLVALKKKLNNYDDSDEESKPPQKPTAASSSDVDTEEEEAIEEKQPEAVVSEDSAVEEEKKVNDETKSVEESYDKYQPYKAVDVFLSSRSAEVLPMQVQLEPKEYTSYESSPTRSDGYSSSNPYNLSPDTIKKLQDLKNRLHNWDDSDSDEVVEVKRTSSKGKLSEKNLETESEASEGNRSNDEVQSEGERYVKEFEKPVTYTVYDALYPLVVLLSMCVLVVAVMYGKQYYAPQKPLVVPK